MEDLGWPLQTKGLGPHVMIMLALVSLAGLFTAAAVGVPLGFSLAVLVGLPLWASALSGGGWAAVVAGFLLWATIR